VNFNIVFENSAPIQVQLDDTSLGNRYYNLIKSVYEDDTNVIFRDQKYYTLDVFRSLAFKAKKELGWIWNIDDLSTSNLTLLHKDIEKLVGSGYDNIPAEHDELVHEIHYALHALDCDDNNNGRGAWLQLEWYNSSGFAITQEEYPGKIACKFGDIKLQNPFVGHNPLFLYKQNDYTAIEQTCKFHNLCKPGINILISDYNLKYNEQDYYTWFNTHCPEFIQKHSWKTIQAYTGEAVVGKVLNTDVLHDLLQKPYLTFKKFDF